MMHKNYFLSKLEMASIFLKVWGFLGSAITFIIATGMLSTDIRGYFFTFFSLASIQIIFEGGFNYTLMQLFAQQGTRFNSIEKKFSKNLTNIFKNGFYRMIKVVALYIFSSIFLGYFIFTNNLNGYSVNEIIIPWILFVLSTSIKLLLMVFEAFFEGMGEIYFVTIARILSSIISSFILWIFLLTPYALYGLGFSVFGYLLVSLIIYFFKYSNLSNFFYYALINKYSDKLILSNTTYQNKIAVSWISGFFVFQSYSIFELYLNGPTSAGVLGVAVSISTVILSLMGAWVYTKSSIINEITASGNNEKLKPIFYYLQNKIIISSILLFLLIIIAYYAESKYFHFFRSMPNLFIVVIFVLGSIFTSYIGLIASFVRAKNMEPFFYPSIAHAISTLFLLLLLVKPYPILGASLAFILPIVLISLPSSLVIKHKYLNF